MNTGIEVTIALPSKRTTLHYDMDIPVPLSEGQLVLIGDDDLASEVTTVFLTPVKDTCQVMARLRTIRCVPGRDNYDEIIDNAMAVGWRV